ncbi:uncharacterized protein BDZ83DRAFT_591629 [Colletotrichum acutatum]|uniref:Uncharacterized protein n=1 Tax=Glomerella acutata TaxID=27357 RepID=A0AAD8UBW4_GLOAC|nr:uncharacterized protein BDZ83DRAFT_591629 [Colletotrichum acutatum]KAK1710035.1 hypothetical protein BDZ83DRAFT_591629 [Colletotrichum acutatum]
MAETTTLPHISSLVQPAIRTVVSSEDNWKGKTSPAERRKIQNRLNQRTWNEDLDDIYQLFLQHAHESRRSPSPDPMSDSLIPLVQFNLFRGLMENMKTLGITMPMICDDDCVSPFGSDPMYNANTTWNIPYFLKPTETQLTTVHHPWLDFLPLPRMRDNLIKAGDDWDDEALCLDMVGDGDAPSGKGGMILWGEPWDPHSWEVTEDFVEKWRWILEGCEEIIRSSNYWRAKRGEKRMRVRI